MSVKVITLDDFWTFDYSKFIFPAKGDSLDGLRAYYGFFTHPAVAFASVACYLLFSAPVCAFIASSLGLSKASLSVKLLTIVHSLLLAIYSGWTFYNTFNIVSGVHGLYVASEIAGIVRSA